MEAMEIDLRTIKIWVAKWEEGKSAHQTASQVAAVMLNRALVQTEERRSRIKALLKGILEQSAALEVLQKRLLTCIGRKQGLDPETERDLKAHRRRMNEMMKAADEELRACVQDQSIRVGGLLLQLKAAESSTESYA